MSRLLVVGGTGTAGRQVVAEALRRGHDVTVASRRGLDMATGIFQGVRYLAADIVTIRGLERALDGTDVVIDTTNGVSRSSRAVLTVGAENLLNNAALMGVCKAVLLSIVNVDRSSYGYYRAKAAQEQIYRESVLETRIVRATQFHDFVTSILAGGSRFGVIPVIRKTSFQPIATRDVAGFLLDAAEEKRVEANGTADFGGPEVLTMRQLARQWRARTGTKAIIASIRAPRGAGHEWRAGLNLVPERALGTVTYSQWLAESAG